MIILRGENISIQGPYTTTLGNLSWKILGTENNLILEIVKTSDIWILKWKAANISSLDLMHTLRSLEKLIPINSMLSLGNYIQESDLQKFKNLENYRFCNSGETKVCKLKGGSEIKVPILKKI